MAWDHNISKAPTKSCLLKAVEMEHACTSMNLLVLRQGEWSQAGAPTQHGVGAAGQWEVCCLFQVLVPLKLDVKYTLLSKCEIQHIIALCHIFRRSLLPVDLLLILIVMSFSKIYPGLCRTDDIYLAIYSWKLRFLGRSLDLPLLSGKTSLQEDLDCLLPFLKNSCAVLPYMIMLSIYCKYSSTSPFYSLPFPVQAGLVQDK